MVGDAKCGTLLSVLLWWLRNSEGLMTRCVIGPFIMCLTLWRWALVAVDGIDAVRYAYVVVADRYG